MDNYVCIICDVLESHGYGRHPSAIVIVVVNARTNLPAFDEQVIVFIMKISSFCNALHYRVLMHLFVLVTESCFPKRKWSDLGTSHHQLPAYIDSDSTILN